MRPSNRVWSAVIAIVITACVSPPLASQSLPPVSELRIVDNAGTSGQQCGAEHVAARLAQLFEAISEGASGIAEEYFGDERGAPFRWFSFTEFYVEPSKHFVTYSADRLDAHFGERHAGGYRLRLRGVTFNRRDGGLLHFGPVEFDFLAPGAAAVPGTVYSGTGKGAYHCPTESFSVLSLGAQGDARDWSPF